MSLPRAFNSQDYLSKAYGKQPALENGYSMGILSGLGESDDFVRDGSAQETKVLVRVGMMLVIFFVSLFGKLLDSTIQFVWITLNGSTLSYSCIIPHNIKAGQVVTHTSGHILHRKALWHRCVSAVTSTSMHRTTDTVTCVS